MTTNHPAREIRGRIGRDDGFRVVGAMAAIMWIVEAINSVDSYRLDREGIVPRHLSGLVGIVCSPFLHASWGHLIGNTVPFIVLGLMIALAGAGRVLAVTAIVALVAGLGTWLIAPSGSVTVGASGVVFGYATYLVARGFINRRVGQLLIGGVVGLLFGASLLWGLIPHSGVSWQDHLFGGVGGVIAARMLASDRVPARRRVGAAPTPS